MPEVVEESCDFTQRSGSCFLTKRYSQRNNHTNIKVIVFGQPLLQASLPSQICHDVDRNLLNMQNSIPFRLIVESKSMKMCIKEGFLGMLYLSGIKKSFGIGVGVVQQNSAFSHRAKSTQNWCRANFPGFISVQEWSAYARDLKPLDYDLCSILKAMACAKPVLSLEAQKRCLIWEWNRNAANERRPKSENFTKHVCLCIKAKGKYFGENLFLISPIHCC